MGKTRIMAIIPIKSRRDFSHVPKEPVLVFGGAEGRLTSIPLPVSAA